MPLGRTPMIPKQLHSLKFCRVQKGTKAPFEKEWNNKPYSYEEISKFDNENYGIQCGYRDLAVIDCDDELLSLAVSQVFPETFSVKTGSGGMHFYYFIPELKKKIILNAGEKHLGEIQSYGTQVVGAGSLHPNGNLYEIINNVGIKTISLEELKKNLSHFMGEEEKENENKEVGEKTKEIAATIDFDKLLLDYGLEKKGENYNCPFHKSIGGQCLSVDKEKGIFNCFHCNWSGNIISFVSRVEDITIKQALDKLKPKKQKPAKIFKKQGQVEHFNEIQPLFYDKSGMWWLWDTENYKWNVVDEIDILNMISDTTNQDTITSKNRTEILNALKQEGRKKIPKPIKKTWIQFKDRVYDFNTGKNFKASPDYFVTNPISWSLDEEKSIDTPIMDKIFEEWVGKDYVQTLYEIIAYCLVPDYPIHRLFCFVGEGLNGKSCFLRLLNNFIGEGNVTSTELDLLISSRFEITRLHKKLVCVMGETNFAEMSKTSVIKKLTGQDMIGFEYKNKNPFDDINYAKILLATNNLPSTTDKTIGFYRRWLIIDFPNRFSEKKDILSEIPIEEYERLSLKCFRILKELLNKREFTNEGSIEDRERKYEEKSDPLEKFLKEYTDLKDPDANIPKWEMEKTLNEWLVENRHRKMADKTISKKMKEKGVEDGRVYVDWAGDDDYGNRKQIRAWLGIKWRKE